MLSEQLCFYIIYDHHSIKKSEESDRMKLKEKITDTAERLYDLSKQKKYNVTLGLTNKITSDRKTAHHKKWHAKNR